MYKYDTMREIKCNVDCEEKSINLVLWNNEWRGLKSCCKLHFLLRALLNPVGKLFKMNSRQIARTKSIGDSYFIVRQFIIMI